ncbi:MAG: PD40 domain-containing protein [Armatimonadetes bacterium]|nr:PD40 domain-containing protein [Armatimonadota bacterium]
MRSLPLFTVLLFAIVPSGHSAASDPDDVCRHLLAPVGDSVGVFLACESGKVQALPIRLPRSNVGEAGRGSAGPVLFPDGRWVAFTRNHNLVLLDLTQGSETRVTQLASDDTAYLRYAVYTTSWAPDSRRLLYCVVLRRGYLGVAPSPASGFFIYDILSGASERILLPGVFECWLRNDEFVVSGETSDNLTATFVVPDRDLFLWSPHDSTAACRLTACCDSNRVSCFTQVTGAPDGSEIAFRYSPAPHSAQIGRLDLEARKILSVTEVASRPIYQWPAYSPNGQRLAFVADGADGSVLQVDGRPIAECPENLAPDRFSWISNRALAVVCGDSLRILDAETGAVLGAVACGRQVFSKRLNPPARARAGRKE